MSQAPTSDLIVCPSCGETNVQGADSCEHCLSDLSAMQSPGWGAFSESNFASLISEIRLSRPATIPASASVRQAIDAVAAEATGAVVILDGAAIAGVFTERDVLKKIAGRPERLADPVTNWMTPDPVVLREDDTMATALHKMGLGGFRHIPLVRDGELVAVVSSRDVLQWLMSCWLD